MSKKCLLIVIVCAAMVIYFIVPQQKTGRSIKNARERIFKMEVSDWDSSLAAYNLLGQEDVGSAYYLNGVLYSSAIYIGTDEYIELFFCEQILIACRYVAGVSRSVDEVHVIDHDLFLQYNDLKTDYDND